MTDTHAADEYARLAALSLELFPESFDAARLRAERAYLNPRVHTRVGRLALVHIERAPCAEDETNFADGNSNHASAEINATTYWLVNGVRFKCDCEAEYSYSVQGHCGGVDEVVGEPGSPMGDPGDIQCTKDEWGIMHDVSRLSVMSRHEAVQYMLEDCEVEIPRAFAERVRRELRLKWFGQHEAPEVELSWDEWGIKGAAPAPEPAAPLKIVPINPKGGFPAMQLRK